jgi:hypothetical protein
LREQFAAQLTGEGLELGPLHNPFPLPHAHALYADKFDFETLVQRNEDLDPESIVRPDFVCDAHTLDGIEDARFGFLVASHVVEHLDNPIKAFHTWCRVLERGASIVCVVPDARFTFDRGRPLTTLNHLLWDYAKDGTAMKRLSDLFHIAECELNMHAEFSPEEAVQRAWEILRDSYDTHFHVWTYETFRDQLVELARHHALPVGLVDSASDGELESIYLLERL